MLKEGNEGIYDWKNGVKHLMQSIQLRPEYIEPYEELKQSFIQKGKFGEILSYLGERLSIFKEQTVHPSNSLVISTMSKLAQLIKKT